MEQGLAGSGLLGRLSIFSINQTGCDWRGRGRELADKQQQCNEYQQRIAGITQLLVGNRLCVPTTARILYIFALELRHISFSLSGEGHGSLLTSRTEWKALDIQQ